MEKRSPDRPIDSSATRELVNAHSAEADVIATFEVLNGQLERYGDQPENNISVFKKTEIL